MSDMKTVQEESLPDIAERVRRSCAGQYALANMFSVVAEDYILPKIRELAAAGQVSKIQVDDLKLRIVQVWNQLMPDHVATKDSLKAGEQSQWSWIVFADILSEDIKSRRPDVIADDERMGLRGFGEDEGMRQRAIDAVVESVVPLLTRGDIAPSMSRATECQKTGEWVKFGLSGWSPILLDMNNNPIPFNQPAAEKTDPEDDSLSF